MWFFKSCINLFCYPCILSTLYDKKPPPCLIVGHCVLGLVSLGVLGGTFLELSAPGYSQGAGFCLYLTGNIQGLWGSGRAARVLGTQKDLSEVLKEPPFPEKLLQSNLRT